MVFIMKKRITLILLCLFITLPSCATFKPHYQTPSVGLKNFRMIPGEKGMLPEFEIILHLINPNRNSLPLHGIVYTISLEEEKLLTGVANDLPTIKGYGAADIPLHATVNLLGGIQLINKFFRGDQAAMKYSFEAKIDTGRFSSPLTIQEKGQLQSLTGNTQTKPGSNL